VNHEALAHRLDQAADRLTTRVLDQMYRDPFWHARFAERAERHGRADGRFHIDYLIQALHASDPSIVENYARWLQQVLTSRGMCTRHLADNFRLLADAIRAEAWPDGEAAIALLDAARAALRYPAASAAHELQGAAPAIARAMNDALALGDPLRTYLVDDLIDYTADAIALDHPAVLANHVTWLADFLAPAGVPRDRLAAALRALTTAASTHAPGSRTAVDAAITPALAALSPP
jgi:hypothetical protein